MSSLETTLPTPGCNIDLSASYILQRGKQKPRAASNQRKATNSRYNTDNATSHITEWHVQETFAYNPTTTPNPIKRVWNRCTARVPKLRPLRRSTLTQWCGSAIRNASPLFGFFSSYGKRPFISDLAAGLSVGVASIPMGMSYALLARVPTAHGLYNNFFFPLIYALFASEAQVCVGTSAIEAMMTGDSVTDIVGPDAPPEIRIQAAVALALAVGIVLCIMRLLKLGAISSLLADPILSGFSTGSAIIIATSQLKHVLGIKIPSLPVPQTWWYIITHLNHINVLALIIGISGILLLYAIKKINNTYFTNIPIPASFFVMTLSIIANYVIAKFSAFRVDIIQEIPRGLPRPMIPSFGGSISVLKVFRQAIYYSVFYFVIHITIAKTVAHKRGSSLKSNQELVACGLCSILGSFFQCFPIATSLSRTSIALASGAQTPVYNFANAAVVGLTLTLITPLLYYLPKAALSSVVLFGVYGMMFFKEGFQLCRLLLPDFFLWLTCFIVVVLWGAMEGVMVAVLLSLLWILKKNCFPHCVFLGRLPGTTVYRDIRRFPMAKELPGIKIFRFDASLHFANADQFQEKVDALLQLKPDFQGSFSTRQPSTVINNTTTPIDGPSLNTRDTGVTSSKRSLTDVLIVDASSINDMDMTAVRMLRDVAAKLKDNDILLLFANWKGPMRDFLEKSSFYASVPPQHCFLALHDAAMWAVAYRDQKLGPTNKETKSDSLQNQALSDDDQVTTTSGRDTMPSQEILRGTHSIATLNAEDDVFNNHLIADSTRLPRSTPICCSERSGPKIQVVIETTEETTRGWPVVSSTQNVNMSN